MKTKFNIRFILPLLVVTLLLATAFIAPFKPVFYIIGDSTTRNSNRPQCGWGEVVGESIHIIISPLRIQFSEATFGKTITANGYSNLEIYINELHDQLKK